MSTTRTTPATADKQLKQQLEYLKLPAILANYEQEAREAAGKQRSHVEYLTRLIDAESAQRADRSTERRIRLARFPVLKTLGEFQWNWPAKINRLQVEDLFRLGFAAQKENVIILGGVGLGKTHLCTALGYAACLQGHSVLFTSAIDIINALTAAQNTGRLKSELGKYLRPQVLIVDELGYLPIDNHGANLLFQVISQRYERGSIILSTNKPFKKWPEIFNNDSTLTSAVLDRLLHHAEAVVIEGKSYRMKDQIEV
jgi:DNA replication protein DnaC